jgi:regulator of sigma E protease
MMFFLIEVLAFVVAIGILVTVHESGHFFAARWLGFDVLKFSIGFGRPLFKRTSRSGVEYVIGVLPLGGYVKLLDEREGPVPAERRGGSFQSRPVWARVVVFLAGPLANFLLALVLFWVLMLMGVPGLKPVVESVRPNSIAAQAGMVAHDEIKAVDAQVVATQEDAMLVLLDRLIGRDAIPMTVVRNGQLQELVWRFNAEQRHAATEPGAWPKAAGFEFVSYQLAPKVGSVMPQGAAARAGLQPQDRIVAIDGVKIADFRDIRAQIEDRPGALAQFEIERAGQRQAVAVAIGSERDTHRMGEPLVGRIGITPAGPAIYPPGLEVLKQYAPWDALLESVRQIEGKSLLTLKFFYKMLTGQVSAKNVSGPIGIAAMAGTTALEGLGPYLDFLALISLSLGILNLLPLPVLDGGQIVLQLIEGFKGSPLSDQALRRIQHMGLLLLAMIMSLAFYNDIAQRLS